MAGAGYLGRGGGIGLPVASRADSGAAQLASTPEAHDAWQTALTRLLGEASGQLKTGGSVARAGADYLAALPQLYAKRQAFEAVAYLSLRRITGAEQLIAISMDDVLPNHAGGRA